MKKIIKEIITRAPILGVVVKQVYFRMVRGESQELFPGSAAYWERRYSGGGNSGAGSYGSFAEFKAAVLNEFVAAHYVQTVIEFGCGDGNQLGLLEYPKYAGFDVSETAISKCRKMFRKDRYKSFYLMNDYRGEKADLTLSLDVIYHLVEDSVFEDYMQVLFQASERYVIIYSSNSDDKSIFQGAIHVRHRNFTSWVEKNMPHWKLVEHLPNQYPYQGDYLKGSFAEFFIYENS